MYRTILSSMSFVTGFLIVPCAPDTYHSVRSQPERVRAYNDAGISPSRKQSASKDQHWLRTSRSPYAIHIFGTVQYLRHRQPV